jgi:hypothetical protein
MNSYFGACYRGDGRFGRALRIEIRVIGRRSS